MTVAWVEVPFPLGFPQRLAPGYDPRLGGREATTVAMIGEFF